ncbi:uncharacterized protein AMSG_02014 [Thecamonas trahens ATCC 50062]|uniref:Uncharacterized protein n=1 Tax=Thecamonas trahens ATCC 50062 TaxID=461836 RepID=A0A0L0DV77_THETB|nr:hypothetical protein AMSG_02014 [Thecamonas trahens ATCC 50062]KNC56001.1 hypothetical protein AMSG_02014 [Thecamonas trahens ATCC 50062]|eukprot:XP_013761047.1 hypothetical protein AMSG_02014 [Thecamonas trahens ATCC 50062]
MVVMPVVAVVVVAVARSGKSQSGNESPRSRRRNRGNRSSRSRSRASTTGSGADGEFAPPAKRIRGLGRGGSRDGPASARPAASTSPFVLADDPTVAAREAAKASLLSRPSRPSSPVPPSPPAIASPVGRPGRPELTVGPYRRSARDSEWDTPRASPRSGSSGFSWANKPVDDLTVDERMMKEALESSIIAQEARARERERLDTEDEFVRPPAPQHPTSLVMERQAGESEDKGLPMINTDDSTASLLAHINKSGSMLSRSASISRLSQWIVEDAVEDSQSTQAAGSNEIAASAQPAAPPSLSPPPPSPPPQAAVSAALLGGRPTLSQELTMRLDRPSPLSSISSSSGTAAANGGASSAPPLPARDAAEWASLVRKMQARNTALQEKLAAEVDLFVR